MNSAKRISPALTMLLAALLTLAPLSVAQKRRGRSQRGASSARPAPTAKPAAPSQSAPTPKQKRKSEPQEEADAANLDKGLAEVVAADSYAMCLEIRNVGQLLGSKEVRELLELVSGAGVGVREISELINFYNAHADELNDVRTYSLILPARPGLPVYLGAFEFDSAEAARLLEPTLRAELGKAEQRARKDLQDARAGQTPSAAGSGRANRPKNAPTPPDIPTLVLKRFGRLILMSGEPFTLKGLRGEGIETLSENARFQMLRSRLSSEPLFFYLDVALLSKGTERMREEFERQAKEVEEAQRSQQTEIKVVAPPPGDVSNVPPEITTDPDAELLEDTKGDMAPPPEGIEESIEVIEGPGEEGGGANPEAELAAQGGNFLTGMLFGELWRESPRWPEAVGAALALDKDAFILRAILLNAPGEQVHPIPFLPTIIAGPLVTSQVATVVPADTEILVSASLNPVQIFNRLTASMSDSYTQAEAGREKVILKAGPEKTSPSEAIAALEKLMGFKLKEDLLPAIGNEFAVSLPLKAFTGGASYNAAYKLGEEKGGQSAVATVSFTPVVLVALNDVEAVKKMLPRLLMFVFLGATDVKPETVRHAGVEINNYGGFAFAYIDNFIALSWDVASLRRMIDARAAQGALATNEEFRAASEWQPRQKLGEVYVSRAFLQSLLDEFTKWTNPKDPEVQQFLTQLNIRPEPISYSVTSEGGNELVHELRVPTAVARYFAAESVLGAKMAPVRQGEMSTLSVLSQIRGTQEEHKKAHGSYATLEELQAKGAKEKQRGYVYQQFATKNLEQLGYIFELVPAGDRYTINATPKEYGKTGRRSFFLDESGIIRAADRGGEAANVNDPPID